MSNLRSELRNPFILGPYHLGMPIVSVVIPAYNCAQYIAETLRSVLDQDYPNLEIIVVDDGSRDNTRDVVTQFHSEKITYLYQRNSGGPSRPRNVGIAHAQGQYVALFDEGKPHLGPKHEREACVDREPMLEALDMALDHLHYQIRFVTIPELLRSGMPYREFWFKRHRLVEAWG